MRGELVALDLETTGLDIQKDAIIEVGLVRIRDGIILDEFGTLINPGFVIPPETTHITGIHQDDLKDAPFLTAILPDIAEFVGKRPVIAHSATFDMGFMRRFGLLKTNLTLDTYELASVLLPSVASYGLSSLTNIMSIDLEHAHRALDDARATALLYWKLWEKAHSVPSAIIAEIERNAQGFDWSSRAFFTALLSELPASTEKTQWPGQSAAQANVSRRDAEAPVQEPREIDKEAIRQLLDEDINNTSHISIPTARPQQLEMADYVASALNQGEHLMIEAGTGTGKSLAYLLPAAMWARQNQQRVMVATNTHPLQDQLLNHEMPVIRDLLRQDIYATVMKGRSNYLCPRRLDALRRQQPSTLEEMRTLAKILVWTTESNSGERHEISLRLGDYQIWQSLSAEDEGCTQHRCETFQAGACPFHKARRAAEQADVIIVNHALVIADAKSENQVLPHYEHIIIDEAHFLEDAISSGLTIRFDQLSLLRRLKSLGTLNTGLLGDLLTSSRAVVPAKQLLRLEDFVKTISDVMRDMQILIQRFFKSLYDFATDLSSPAAYLIRITARHHHQAGFAIIETGWVQLSEYLEVLIEAMARLLDAVQRLGKYDLANYEDHLQAISATSDYLGLVYQEIGQFVTNPDTNWIYWVSTGSTPDAVALHTAPLHVGPLMDQYLWSQKRSVILTSATLQVANNFEFMQERLYAHDIKTVALGSPFNYEDSTLVFIPTDIPEPNKPGYQKAIERGIIELAAALDGRVMVLFTSYSHLRETAASISPRLALGNITVYDQASGGSRETLLENFKSTEKAVLLGTRSFWNGIDIPGDDLSALVIVRLPFAVPTDPFFASRSEAYEDPFLDYAVPDATLRFRQGFGRLIRTETDRGIVAIFDSRIINKKYGSTFLESLPDCQIKQAALSELASTAIGWLK